MCLKILVLVLYFVLAARFCFGDYARCKVPYFPQNSPFDINRLKVLSTLSSDVSSRDNYYYNVTIGEGRGMIFALGLCIPGVERARCSNCIQGLSNSLKETCVNQTNSYEYRTLDGTLCLVRYSDYNIFEALDQDPVSENCNQEDIANVTEFNSVWKDFMEEMIASAASKKYAAKVSSPMGFQRIYSLMLCIPGLSSSNCEVCLRRSIPAYEKACRGRQGSNIRRPPCYFQWETYPFNDAFKYLNVLSQPTQSPDDLPIETKKRIIVAIVVSAVAFVALLALGLVLRKRRISYRTQNLEIAAYDEDITSPHSLQFDFKIIESATDNFSENNKIGQGGFGEVYMGILPNGAEIAVKRLSKNSGQGIQEFKNEVVLVAKLQHKNLVSLLGFCLERDEQILVYEFVPNKSLDYFLFGPTERQHLDWRSRYNIIGGIARGILYLHQDSRFTIIHRDLKASNILLDDDMNPKIADFGMARIFEMEQTRANTSKIAGTFGYMAPEYAMRGHFSMKSDVYSFGVLVLEILSGKMNSSFYETDGSAGNLVTHAWRLWRKGSALKVLDSNFRENYQSDEVTRCIHIALLCVQEDPRDRPLMSTIVLLLSSNTITLELPRAPGFYLQSSRDRDSEVEGLNFFRNPISYSVITVTEYLVWKQPKPYITKPDELQLVELLTKFLHNIMQHNAASGTQSSESPMELNLLNHLSSDDPLFNYM